VREPITPRGEPAPASVTSRETVERRLSRCGGLLPVGLTLAQLLLDDLRLRLGEELPVPSFFATLSISAVERATSFSSRARSCAR